MLKNGLSIKEATEKWVSEFNAIPLSLIEMAYPNMEGIDILSTEKYCTDCGSTEVELNGDEELVCSDCKSDDVYDSYTLPMWVTVWTFGTSLDDEWVKENLNKVADCGFYVYESDELGVFIGIDGAGYDFYENHWIPLYKARGLKWHDSNEE